MGSKAHFNRFILASTSTLKSPLSPRPNLTPSQSREIANAINSFSVPSINHILATNYQNLTFNLMQIDHFAVYTDFIIRTLITSTGKENRSKCRQSFKIVSFLIVAIGVQDRGDLSRLYQGSPGQSLTGEPFFGRRRIPLLDDKRSRSSLQKCNRI